MASRSALLHFIDIQNWRSTFTRLHHCACAMGLVDTRTYLYCTVPSTVDFSSLRICVTMSVRACVSGACRACVARITLCIISRRARSRTHGTHSNSRTLMVTQIRSELKSTVPTFLLSHLRVRMLLMLAAALEVQIDCCSRDSTDQLVVLLSEVSHNVASESHL